MFRLPDGPRGLSVDPIRMPGVEFMQFLRKNGWSEQWWTFIRLQEALKDPFIHPQRRHAVKNGDRCMSERSDIRLVVRLAADDSEADLFELSDLSVQYKELDKEPKNSNCMTCQCF